MKQVGQRLLSHLLFVNNRLKFSIFAFSPLFVPDRRLTAMI